MGHTPVATTHNASGVGCIGITGCATRCFTIRCFAVSCITCAKSIVNIIIRKFATIILAFNIQSAESIHPANRIVAAVCKHVIAQQTLAGGDEGIRVEEPAPLGVVITAL